MDRISVYDENALHCDEEIFELGIPILGICYGMQLMTQHFGGKVERANHREYGKAVIKVENESKLYATTSRRASCMDESW